MRIVAGKWRGRHVAAPDTMDTRPILDRAKVVLFDMLGHRLAQPGTLPPLAVLDLFAGSGALGIEALSRGASYCLFVEQSRPIAAIIRKNLDSLEIIREADVLQADVTRATLKPPPSLPDTPDSPVRYGLVFVDPPYRLLAGPKPAAGLRELFRTLAHDSVIAPDALIVVRHEAQGATSPDLAPLVERERRDVGNMTFRFMMRPE
jgi:16S rRNA (guanine966-N2)-methyltransferase